MVERKANQFALSFIVLSLSIFVELSLRLLHCPQPKDSKITLDLVALSLSL